MPKKKRQQRAQPPENNVSHPRYGAAPLTSSTPMDLGSVRSSFWRYRVEKVYPETAIRADTSHQNFTTFPRNVYVDIQKTCRVCMRPFIFFAREQQFWYEVLKLYIDVDCVYCTDCRKNIRQTKHHREIFSAGIAEPPNDVRKLVELLESGIYLWETGELKNEHTLRRLKNLAHSEVPTLAVRAELDALVEGIANQQ